MTESYFMPRKKLIIIDGHALVHRAYHALPPLSTNTGELVNAVFGFTTFILRVIRDINPEYIVATFDLPSPTFRHKEFDEYKATRVKAPEELYGQIKRVQDILRAFNIPIFEKEGFEADDVIGTIAHQMKGKKDVETIIVTGDLDTLQLVDEKTKVLTIKRKITESVLYGEAGVFDRYSLRPDQMLDFKGLKGDASDNIPGVPGIGEKRAIQILQEFGSLDNLYKQMEDPLFQSKNITKSVKQKLVEFKDQAFFSKYLATIKKDVPLEFKLEDTITHDFKREDVARLFKDLGFFSLIEKIPRSLHDDKAPIPLEEKEEVYEKIELARRDGILSDKIYKLEKDLVPIIDQMQKNGIRIDIGRLKGIDLKIVERLAWLNDEICRLAGCVFNINSPQQLSEILFEKLRLPIKGLKKTPGKVISTAAPELAKLAGAHPVIDLIIEHRELAKIKNTYIDTLPELVGKDGRLHTTFDQLGTVTGRLSSKTPNLQNIPVKTEWGAEVRKSFVADPGCLLISADYSQIELRIVASIAKDKKMIESLLNGGDIHLITASKVFNTEPEEVSKRMRNAAKVLNFGVIYGMSIHSFAQAAGIDFEKAKEFVDKYFEEFSGVAEYIENIKKQAAEKGFVQTIFGRKRFIPEINSSAWNLKQAAERTAINMPVQGTAADLIKIAMVEVDKLLALPQNPDIKMLLQVHDELVFEIKKDKTKELAQKIKYIMENVYRLDVPLKAEIKAGENWGEMERI